MAVGAKKANIHFTRSLFSSASRCSSFASNLAKLSSLTARRSLRYVASTLLNRSTSSLVTIELLHGPRYARLGGRVNTAPRNRLLLTGLRFPLHAVRLSLIAMRLLLCVVRLLLCVVRLLLWVVRLLICLVRLLICAICFHFAPTRSFAEQSADRVQQSGDVFRVTAHCSKEYGH